MSLAHPGLSGVTQQVAEDEGEGKLRIDVKVVDGVRNTSVGK